MLGIFRPFFNASIPFHKPWHLFTAYFVDFFGMDLYYKMVRKAMNSGIGTYPTQKVFKATFENYN